MKMNEPTVAYVVMENGERIDCLLERVSENEWQATAVKDIDIMHIESFFVDVLPSRSAITIVTQFAEEGEDL